MLRWKRRMPPSSTSTVAYSSVSSTGAPRFISLALPSRVDGVTSATKTSHSERIISIDDKLLNILMLLPSKKLGIKHLFVCRQTWRAYLEEMGRTQLGEAIKRTRYPASQVLLYAAHFHHRRSPSAWRQAQTDCLLCRHKRGNDRAEL